MSVSTSHVSLCCVRTLSCSYWSDFWDHVKFDCKNDLSQTFYKLLCIYINMKWHGLITRWTMHWFWTQQRNSGLILGSTQMSVWLDQTPVVQQVAPSVCGWTWMIVHLVELSHLIRGAQHQWSTAVVGTSGMTHIHLPIFQHKLEKCYNLSQVWLTF